MTDFLFNRPSFWGGAAAIIDIFGSLPEYNASENAEEADRRAHIADLVALRGDMKNALAEVLPRE